MARRGLLRWLFLYPRIIWLTLRSQLHNSNRDLEWLMVQLTYPIHVLLNTGLRYAGPGFVFAVIVLISCVVLNWYLFLLPALLMRHSLPVVVLHLFVSHWLLTNIAFHYWKAWRTPAGRPRYVQSANESGLRHDWSWCKKCLQPKPPRTHHCSVCKMCTLKMDHHCPWLNNCVGHNNHRYFWMFCFYMCMGVLYVSVTSFPIVLDDYYGNDIPVPSGQLTLFWIANLLPADSWLTAKYTAWQTSSRLSIFLLTSGVLLTLGSLTGWHTWLISQATSSIEKHTNKVEARRLARQQMFFKNPYDFGLGMNWRLFLGLVEGRSWRHFLLPSGHLAIGDGHHWDYSPYLEGVTRRAKAHDV